MHCRSYYRGDLVAVKMYTGAGGSARNLMVAQHEIEAYYSHQGPAGPVEGMAHMVDHILDEAAGMACMIQE